MSEQQATDSGYSEAYVTKLRAEIARLREALLDIFSMMDDGILVRDISRDGAPDYHTRALAFVMRLQKARKALETVDEEKT